MITEFQLTPHQESIVAHLFKKATNQYKSGGEKGAVVAQIDNDGTVRALYLDHNNAQPVNQGILTQLRSES